MTREESGFRPADQTMQQSSRVTHPMRRNPNLWIKFWLGAVMPVIGLALVVGMTIASGRGRGEAPMVLFFTSLVAVPAVMLLNCWVLFVAWSSRMRMLAGASVLPAVVGLSGLLVVHGAGLWRDAGMFMLLPFLTIPVTHPRAMGAAWALGLMTALWAAYAVQRSRGQ